ncbi:MAG: energy-coupling factor ABC transporter ATP-binding protein [Chloroflexi bacterium]|nr:energy-coupling factor ABC transporter ATP-binding protein [Chloroflexota bacterium]
MTPILQLEEVRYTYPGNAEPALRGANLSLWGGKKIAVLGRNGSGKSTLFLHCNGILRPDGGQLYLAGKPVKYDRGSLLGLRRHVGIVFQNPDDQLFSASVVQDMSFGPLNLGLSQVEASRRVEEAAEQCEIVDLLDRPTHALSGGQKARVALAGVLAMEPSVILVDEVMASLDPWMRDQILSILHDFAARGRTVVLATHDLALARTWADLVAVMEGGRVLAVDTPDVIFSSEAMLAHLGPRSAWFYPPLRSASEAALAPQGDRATKPVAPAVPAPVDGPLCEPLTVPTERNPHSNGSGNVHADLGKMTQR